MLVVTLYVIMAAIMMGFTGGPWAERTSITGEEEHEGGKRLHSCLYTS
jgi:hypothetical protein